MLIDLRFSFTDDETKESYFYILPGIAFWKCKDRWGFYVYWLCVMLFVGVGDYYEED